MRLSVDQFIEQLVQHLGTSSSDDLARHVTEPYLAYIASDERLLRWLGGVASVLRRVVGLAGGEVLAAGVEVAKEIFTDEPQRIRDVLFRFRVDDAAALIRHALDRPVNSMRRQILFTAAIENLTLARSGMPPEDRELHECAIGLLEAFSLRRIEGAIPDAVEVAKPVLAVIAKHVAQISARLNILEATLAQRTATIHMMRTDREFAAGTVLELEPDFLHAERSTRPRLTVSQLIRNLEESQRVLKEREIPAARELARIYSAALEKLTLEFSAA